MVRTHSRRPGPAPPATAMVLRGLLGEGELHASELRMAAVTNHDLYGFYGISVWLADVDFTVEVLEQTKLVHFERYAQFNVAALLEHGLALAATGQPPHYDVVAGDSDDVELLVQALLAVPHRVLVNPYLDREEA